MKKIRYLVCIVLLIIMLIGNVFSASNVLDLNTVIQKALDKSTDLAGMDKNISNAEQSYRRAVSTAGFIMSRDSYGSEITKDIAPLNAQYMVDSSKRAKQMLTDNIILGTLEQYINLIKLNESLVLQKKLTEDLEKNYTKVKNKYNLGKVSTIELKTTELSLSKSRLEYSKLQKNINIAKIALNKAIGQQLTDMDYELKAINAPVEITIDTIENYLPKAYSYAPEAVNAKQNLEVTTKEYDITKRYYYYDTTTQNLDAVYKLQQAKDNMEAAKINTEIKLTNLYKTAEQKIAAVQKNKLLYQNAENSFVEMQKKYNMGLVTEKTLSDAETQYINLKLQYNNSRYDAWLSKLKLEYFCGIKDGFKIVGGSIGGSL